ncbi:MAG: hypothetical protein SGI83_17000 [Bacteroidota bacterium]|nr:hypothetical protein [Bacteroidota bacterium]
MKRVYFLLYFAGMMLLVVNTACNKQAPAIGSGSIPINPPPPPNRPPIAIAGLDFTGILYSNSITLWGNAYNTDIGDTVLTTWSKIAGPPCTIVSPQQLITKVTNLLVGEYQFELLASDKYGATDRDTVVLKITSFEQITSPINFSNLIWSCGIDICVISIFNIYSNIPSNTSIRIYIKLVNSTDWHEAFPVSLYPINNAFYYYEIISDNIINLYTDFQIDNIDVKILF